ncbi:hypothetical protein CSUNSWCD_1176 [Campylobacter showae CSUNSWCD]|uniref:Uncharacterized protein n=1 Tax=Campylobacter showae CSUNSWCD TaxID=1244083 RepID=M5IH61_9BACT|nr:hypothetical protein CSUNSWCD_1176 [Campylobacter showae CSUNSWCD]
MLIIITFTGPSGTAALKPSSKPCKNAFIFVLFSFLYFGFYLNLRDFEVVKFDAKSGFNF